MKILKNNKIYYCKAPCSNCPFRKDSLKGWLGENKIKSILSSDSFICHKTMSEKTPNKQCAGHMIIKGSGNLMHRFLKYLKRPFKLSGQELVHDSEEDLINHHKIQ